MATSYIQLATVFAILVVGASLFSVGLSGFATVQQPMDFYVRSLDFPSNILHDNPFRGTAVFVNTGNTSATFVAYDYAIYDYRGANVYRGEIKDSYVNLPISSAVNVTLQPVDLKNGTYFVKLKIDSENHFVESNETNNEFVTTIRVI